jgi:DNA-directed RNA polymerase subunit omega
MAPRRSSMIDPPIEKLLDRVDSKFSLVTVSARRARQINQYFNQLGSEGLGMLVPPQVSSTSRKPLSIALEEIVADKIEIRKASEVAAEKAAAQAAAAAAAADAAAAEINNLL